MESEFWHQRWKGNLIGFHQHEINIHLKAFWDKLPVKPGDRVLVPLCGKSRDMLWLAEQHPVTGVELSPVAVEDFFRENDLDPDRYRQGAFPVCESGNLKLLCGDFFDLQPEQLGQVCAVYDRASLIALPADMRRAFVAKLTSLLSRPVSMLLVTLEYEQQQMGGPPFSVEEGEVREMFEANWSVQLLHEEDVLATESKFRERGLSHLSEKIYLLERR